MQRARQTRHDRPESGVGARGTRIHAVAPGERRCARLSLGDRHRADGGGAPGRNLLSRPRGPGPDQQHRAHRGEPADRHRSRSPRPAAHLMQPEPTPAPSYGSRPRSAKSTARRSTSCRRRCSSCGHSRTTGTPRWPRRPGPPHGLLGRRPCIRRFGPDSSSASMPSIQVGRTLGSLSRRTGSPCLPPSRAARTSP